jgi:pimeloyl-ACP methyl ester carboxylesterase
MITMDWLHRYPTDFQNAIIINSSSRNTSPTHRRLSPFGMKRFLKIAKSKNAYEKEGHILDFNSNIARVEDPTLHQRWTQFAEEQPLPTSNALIQLAAAMRFNAPKELPVRTLFISSQQDRLTNPQCTWELARRFKAPVIFHDKAGHDIPLDAPEWLATEIHRWVNLPQG